MRQKRGWLGACLAGLLALGAIAAEPPPPAQQEQLKAVETAYSVAALREIAVQNSAAAVKMFFSPAATLRWQRIATEYSEEQINDFFQGAMVLTDGKSEKDAGLYNPWWDAVLLLQATGLPEVPKVEKFCFVSGVRFRAEKGVPLDKLVGVVPQGQDSLAMELCDLVAKTAKYYLENYRNDARLFAKLQTADAKDTQRIQMRSGVRLKLWVRFLQSKPMQREAKRIARYLQFGNETKMLKYFTDGGADFLKAFAQLPSPLRRRFVPYCYIPGKEGTLLLFVNAETPRILVTVTLPRNDLRRIMEWYDLAKAEDYLKLWRNAQKEVAK